MLYVKSPLTDMEETFALFHGSSIESWTGDFDSLKLTVECVYLAECINKSFRNFYLQFSAIDKLELHLWAYPPDVDNEVVTELRDIFWEELEIVSTKRKKESLEIMCFQHRYPRDRQGATLHISCGSIEILDQANNEITTDRLSHLCSDYWDAFCKRKQGALVKKQA
ncbi:MAG: hypothetical protein WCT04_21395 [Planctomycetota bacterium]